LVPESSLQAEEVAAGKRRRRIQLVGASRLGAGAGARWTALSTSSRLPSQRPRRVPSVAVYALHPSSTSCRSSVPPAACHGPAIGCVTATSSPAGLWNAKPTPSNAAARPHLRGDVRSNRTTGRRRIQFAFSARRRSGRRKRG